MGPCSQVPIRHWVPRAPALTGVCRGERWSWPLPQASTSAWRGATRLRPPGLPSAPRSSGAAWWARGQLAAGAVHRETLGRGLRLRGKRQRQSPRKNPLISIPRALHFFSRKAPTFSSESKYHALILCVNRLALQLLMTVVLENLS